MIKDLSSHMDQPCTKCDPVCAGTTAAVALAACAVEGVYREALGTMGCL